MDIVEIGETGTPEALSLHISTRYAVFSDLAEVLDMYVAGLREIQEFIMPLDITKCHETVLESFKKAPCVLIEKSNKIIGFAGLTIFVPSHCYTACLTEYMYYIKPQQRSIKASLALSNAVKSVADKFKMPLYLSHALLGKTAQLKEKFLKRWGYTPVCIGVMYGGNV